MMDYLQLHERERCNVLSKKKSFICIITTVWTTSRNRKIHLINQNVWFPHIIFHNIQNECVHIFFKCITRRWSCGWLTLTTIMCCLRRNIYIVQRRKSGFFKLQKSINLSWLTSGFLIVNVSSLTCSFPDLWASFSHDGGPLSSKLTSLDFLYQEIRYEVGPWSNSQRAKCNIKRQ